MAWPQGRPNAAEHPRPWETYDKDAPTMQDSEMREKLEKIIKAYEELQAKMSDPAVLADQK